MWTVPEAKSMPRTNVIEEEKLNLVAEGCDTRAVSVFIHVLSYCGCNSIKHKDIKE